MSSYGRQANLHLQLDSMTRNILKVSDFLAAIKDSRCEQLIIGNLSFTQFDSVTISTNRDVLIRSSTKGTIFNNVTVDGSETVSFEGVIIDRLTVTAGSTVNLIDCDVQVLESAGNCGVSTSTVSSLDISGIAHVVDTRISGFTCIRRTGRATLVKCWMTGEDIVTVAGASAQFTNCWISRMVNTDSLVGWVASKLPKYFIPRVELPPAKYIGCRMNFRVKKS